MKPSSFPCGVIEGFYGRPWTFRFRRYVLKEMARCGLNTFVYAPKFDPYHRLHWERRYPSRVLKQFENLIQYAKAQGVTFLFSLSPGLSYDFTRQDHFDRLCDKYRQFYTLGVRAFGLFMDDIHGPSADGKLHSSLMAALRDAIPRDVIWFFCPTFYSDWHIRREPNANDYLTAVGTLISPEIRVLWTGPTIISRSIEQDCLQEITKILKRKPCIWDNFHAVDYLPATALYTGPLSGRDPNFRSYSTGYFMNMSQWSYPSLLAMRASAPFLAYGRGSSEDAWSDAIDTYFARNQDTVRLILGYFYTPWSVSRSWETLLETITRILRTGSDTGPIMERLKEISTCISDDSLIDDQYEFWCDLFPFVQTLRGDIDFALRFLSAGAQHREKPDPRILRDQRWSTPLYHCILSQCMESR